MNQTSPSPLRVDIVSDVVCPWCVIGFRQLEQAAARTGAAMDVHWHPFELNRNMPPEGQNLREHVAEKYGASPEDSAKAREMMSTLGNDLGITFSFSEDSRIVNTFQAHQLLAWAATHGREGDLKLAFFDAYFTQGRDVSDEAILLDVVSELGLDRDEAALALSEQRFADDVREREDLWVSRGVQGVPAMIFNERHLVTGAQGVDNFAHILEHLMTAEAEQASEQV